MTELSDKSIGALDVLIDCLSREDELLSFLLIACDDQTEALKSNDHKAVETAVSKVGSLLNGINAVEEERVRSKEVLDTELGLAPDSSLEDLLSFVDGEYWEKVNALNVEMSVKAERLQSTNELNRILTKQVLDFSGAMLASVNPKGSLTYGAAGLEQGISRPGKSLLNKTI